MGALNQQKPEWVDECEKKFGGAIREFRHIHGSEFEIFIEATSVRAVLAYLKSRPNGAFEHLADLTAYDQHPASPRFCIVYELISMQEKLRARVVAYCADDHHPFIDTVCDMWGGANWLEREVYDLFGVEFKNHPDLRRLFLAADFVGHPLRKDFIVDYRQSYPTNASPETAFDPFGNTVVQGEGIE